MKIKKGDNVIISTGKDKGSKGKVLKVYPLSNTVVVEGVNIAKKHKRANRRDTKGQMVKMPMPINASNVMVADSSTGKGVRVGKKEIGGKMVRVSKKTGNEI